LKTYTSAAAEVMKR